MNNDTKQMTLADLEKATPIIESDYSYDAELTNDETREHEQRIAVLSIEIDKLSQEIKNLREEIAADVSERQFLAATLDKGKAEKIADTAAKFYDPETGTISVYIKEDDVFIHVLSREAYSTEVEQWKRLQEEIRQTEIEAGDYRLKLQMLAGETN